MKSQKGRDSGICRGVNGRDPRRVPLRMILVSFALASLPRELRSSRQFGLKSPAHPWASWQEQVWHLDGWSQWDNKKWRRESIPRKIQVLAPKEGGRGYQAGQRSNYPPQEERKRVRNVFQNLASVCTASPSRNLNDSLFRGYSLRGWFILGAFMQKEQESGTNHKPLLSLT